MKTLRATLSVLCFVLAATARVSPASAATRDAVTPPVEPCPPVSVQGFGNPPVEPCPPVSARGFAGAPPTVPTRVRTFAAR